MAEFRLRLLQQLGWVLQCLGKSAFHEACNHVVECQCLLRLTHLLVQIYLALLERCTEESHVDVLHQVLKFSLILLDVLVGAIYLLQVVLVLQMQFALLAYVAYV